MVFSDGAVEQWKLDCAARSNAYDAGLRAGKAAADAGREKPSGVPDERYASSYRTGWDHGWIRAVRAAEVLARARRAAADSAALDRLATLIGSREWNADLLEPVCGILRAAGRTVADINDVAP